LAVTFPLSGRFRDLHPLEYVRAGRTKKARINQSLCGLIRQGYFISFFGG